MFRRLVFCFSATIQKIRSKKRIGMALRSFFRDRHWFTIGLVVEQPPILQLSMASVHLCVNGV